MVGFDRASARGHEGQMILATFHGFERSTVFVDVLQQVDQERLRVITEQARSRSHLPPLVVFLKIESDGGQSFSARTHALAGSGVLTTTGEHEYTRYGFRKLIADRAVDVLQPDITWCGGITEARRIYSLAAAFDVPCVPHGSSVYSFHLQFACAQSPFAECLIMSPEADRVVLALVCEPERLKNETFRVRAGHCISSFRRGTYSVALRNVDSSVTERALCSVFIERPRMMSRQ